MYSNAGGSEARILMASFRPMKLLKLVPPTARLGDVADVVDEIEVVCGESVEVVCGESVEVVCGESVEVVCGESVEVVCCESVEVVCCEYSQYAVQPYTTQFG